MASTFTAFLKFNKPALGDAGWGTAVNGGFTDLVDQAITGFIEKAVTAAGPNALGSIADGASSDARNQFILLTGTLASPATLTVPVGTLTGSAGNNKLYFIKNTAGNSVTITNGGASTVVVPDGKSMMLRSTSTGVEEAMTHQFSLSLGTALAAPSGGTGQSSYAVGDLLYADTTTTLAKLAAVATGSVLRSKGVGTAPAWEQVVLTTDVTGVLPVANGGTGAATLAANNVLLGNGTSAVQEVAPGTSGNVLTASGGTWVSAALPVAGVNATVYTSGSGSFTIPTGVAKLKVTVVGGGGGSSGNQSGQDWGGGGAGGGTAIVWLTGVTPGNTISYAVGAGGTAGANPNGNGGAGNASSISSGTEVITTVTANGGGGGTFDSAGLARNATGGTATNGTLNISGGSVTNSVIGGNSTLSTEPGRSTTPTVGKLYGGGASASVAPVGNSGGAVGAAGVVIFEW